MSARSRSRTVSISPCFRRTLEQSTDLSGTPQSVLRALRKAQLRDAAGQLAPRPAPWLRRRSPPRQESRRPEDSGGTSGRENRRNKTRKEGATPVDPTETIKAASSTERIGYYGEGNNIETPGIGFRQILIKWIFKINKQDAVSS